MDERTREMLTTADPRVEAQVTAQRGVGPRTRPLERLDLDDGHCSCHPHPAQTAAAATTA